jgi:hypothetical protein
MEACGHLAGNHSIVRLCGRGHKKRAIETLIRWKTNLTNPAAFLLCGQETSPKNGGRQRCPPDSRSVQHNVCSCTIGPANQHHNTTN